MGMPNRFIRDIHIVKVVLISWIFLFVSPAVAERDNVTRFLYPEAITAYSNEDGFGSAMVMSSTHLVIASSGKAFIFKKDASGNFSSTASSSITAYSSEPNFGKAGAMAISDTHLVIGSAGAGCCNKAYIFEKDEFGDFPIEATDVIADYSGHVDFGVSVAVSSTHIAVGASGVRMVFVFKKEGGNFSTTATSLIAGYRSQVEFGKSVALSETHLVVGAPGSGSAFIFKKDLASGDFPIIATTEIRNCCYFGSDVVLSNTHLAITAEFAKKVFVYAKDANGDYPVRESSSKSGYPNFFIGTLALSADYLAFGAYTLPDRFGNFWQEMWMYPKDRQGHFFKSEQPSIRKYGNRAYFGATSAISASHLVLGAHGDKQAFVYKAVVSRSPTNWSCGSSKTWAYPQLFTFSQGEHLNSPKIDDTVKVVANGSNCSVPPAGGTSEATGPSMWTLQDDVGSYLNRGSNRSTITASLTWNSPGLYKLCYRLTLGKYVQVGPTIDIKAPPTSWEILSGRRLVNELITVNFTDGMELNPLDQQDSAKVVNYSTSCDAEITGGGGTTELTNLGDAGEVNISLQTWATASFTWSLPGTFRLCYRRVGSGYVQVGSNFTIAAPPASWTIAGGKITDIPQTITFSGGTHLNLHGQDAAKAVASTDLCSASPAGGSRIVKWLRPGDGPEGTSVTAKFTWLRAGRYNLCYKLSEGTYTQVGTTIEIAMAPWWLRTQRGDTSEEENINSVVSNTTGIGVTSAASYTSISTIGIFLLGWRGLLM